MVEKKKGKPSDKVKRIVGQVEESIKDKPEAVLQIEWVSSGSTWLDLALGGGFPFGRVVNIVGNFSTGKTLLVCETIFRGIQEYRGGLEYFFDNSEMGLTFDTRVLWGYDLPDIEESSYTVEQWEANVDRRLREKNPGGKFIYVTDSTDGLTCREEEERAESRIAATLKGKEITGGTYAAEKAKFLSAFFRRFKDRLMKGNCLLLMTSQIRDDIASRFNTKTRSGGRALDFYASQIIWLSKVETITKKDVPVGVVVLAEVRKNKVGKPFRKAYFYILFDYGIDNVTGNIDYLFDLRTEGGKGRKIINVKWDGKEFKVKSALVKYIEDNGQEDLLDSMVRDKWVKFEDSIAPKRKRKH